MKSTLKIAFQSNMNPELPVVKIVQPIDYREGIFNPVEDHDPKDEMLSAFISKPASNDHYPIYEVSTSFPHPMENPTHWITTIRPVEETIVLYRLRHMVLNRLVPYETIVTLNSMTNERLAEYFNGDPNKKEIGYLGAEEYKKIHDFFDWVEKQELS